MRAKSLPAFTVLLLVMVMTACGGGDLFGPDTKQYPRVVITTASLPEATVGTAYNFTMTATGGSGEFLWIISSGTLPPGLRFDIDGRFTGTPSIAGRSTITIRTQHTCYCVPQREAQEDSKTFELVVR